MIFLQPGSAMILASCLGFFNATGPFTRVVFLPCSSLCQSPASLRKINPTATVLQAPTRLLLTSQHLKIYESITFSRLWIWDDSDSPWYWEEHTIPRISGLHPWKPWDELLVESSKPAQMCVLFGVFPLFPFQAVIRQMWGFHSCPNKNIFFENLKAF